jgi:hypothetical protein
MATSETMSFDAKLTLLLASMGAFGRPTQATLNTARMVFGEPKDAPRFAEPQPGRPGGIVHWNRTR